MPKSLYREGTFSLTSEAYELYAEIDAVVSPIQEKYTAMGYSPREVEQIAQYAIQQRTAYIGLRLAIKFHRSNT